MTMSREDYESLPLISIHGRTGDTHHRATLFDAWDEAHTEDMFRTPRVGDLFHKPMGPSYEVLELRHGYISLRKRPTGGLAASTERLELLTAAYSNRFARGHGEYGWTVVCLKRGPACPVSSCQPRLMIRGECTCPCHNSPMQPAPVTWQPVVPS